MGALMKARKEGRKIKKLGMSRGWEGLQTGCFRIDEDRGEEGEEERMGRRRARRKEREKVIN